MRDWSDDDPGGRTFMTHGDDDHAWTVLGTFFPAAPMLVPPEIRVTNDKARDRFG
jgi:hypothetical protein